MPRSLGPTRHPVTFAPADTSCRSSSACRERWTPALSNLLTRRRPTSPRTARADAWSGRHHAPQRTHTPRPWRRTERAHLLAQLLINFSSQGPSITRVRRHWAVAQSGRGHSALCALSLSGTPPSVYRMCMSRQNLAVGRATRSTHYSAGLRRRGAREGTPVGPSTKSAGACTVQRVEH